MGRLWSWNCLQFLGYDDMTMLESEVANEVEGYSSSEVQETSYEVYYSIIAIYIILNIVK